MLLFSNSSDTFTVTGKNSCKIAFGDEFCLQPSRFLTAFAARCKYLSELLHYLQSNCANTVTVNSNNEIPSKGACLGYG